MNASDTFLIPSDIGTHLNIVLGVLPDGSLIITHLTSRRRYSDATCVIQPGEHPFVKQETVARYDQTHICPQERIPNLEGVITKRLDPLSPALLARMQQGALASPQTPENIKALLKPLVR
jgi:hypothetical protein